jgi:hypothetical protein
MQKSNMAYTEEESKVSEKKSGKASSVNRRVHLFLRGLKIRRQAIDAGKITWVHGVGCIRQVRMRKRKG